VSCNTSGSVQKIRTSAADRPRITPINTNKSREKYAQANREFLIFRATYFASQIHAPFALVAGDLLHGHLQRK
jgi:hypothetical protein